MSSSHNTPYQLDEPDAALGGCDDRAAAAATLSRAEALQGITPRMFNVVADRQYPLPKQAQGVEQRNAADRFVEIWSFSKTPVATGALAGANQLDCHLRSHCAPLGAPHFRISSALRGFIARLSAAQSASGSCLRAAHNWFSCILGATTDRIDGRRPGRGTEAPPVLYDLPLRAA